MPKRNPKHNNKKSQNRYKKNFSKLEKEKSIDIDELFFKSLLSDPETIIEPNYQENTIIDQYKPFEHLPIDSSKIIEDEVVKFIKTKEYKPSILTEEKSIKFFNGIYENLFSLLENMIKS